MGTGVNVVFGAGVEDGVGELESIGVGVGLGMVMVCVSLQSLIPAIP